MVAAHLPRLKKVYVLPSHETLPQIVDFKAYIEALFGREIPLATVTAADDQPYRDESAADERASRSYDNYAYMRGGLKRAVAMAEEAFPGTRDDDICVDGTAGLKLLSIAAAVVTFDSNLKLGYVVTGSPEW